MHKHCKEKSPRRNCLHEILDNLVIHHNDYRRMSSEMKNLQTEFKFEMQRLQFPCENLRKLLCCKNYDKTEGESFLKRISQINELYNCFTLRIEELNGHIKDLLDNAKICLEALAVSKESLRKSHERNVEELKRLAIMTLDSKEAAEHETKICELQKLFVKEVTYVKQVETQLQPFFDHLRDNTTQQYLQTSFSKNYEWLPTEKHMNSLNATAAEMASKMGSSLVKAFAQLHVYQPTDVKGFLANYLLNLEHNQKLLQEKLELLKPKENETTTCELTL